MLSTVVARCGITAVFRSAGPCITQRWFATEALNTADPLPEVEHDNSRENYACVVGLPSRSYLYKNGGRPNSTLRFTLTKRFKKKDGNPGYTHVPVLVTGPLADSAAKQLMSGKRLMVEGRLVEPLVERANAPGEEQRREGLQLFAKAISLVRPYRPDTPDAPGTAK